jgi:hypothetical protein
MVRVPASTVANDSGEHVVDSLEALLSSEEEHALNTSAATRSGITLRSFFISSLSQLRSLRPGNN